MLFTHKLSCRRGDGLLWQNLEFEISPGQLLAVTGANGCGKTSLLRILAGLAPAAAGVVYWQGVAITTQKSLYSQQLHYIGHQPAVKNELSVKEHLQFNIQIRDDNHLLAALEQAELSAYIDHFGYQLSQGQKQRLALTKLLCHKAPLWILDEPFAGLDTQMTEKLQQIFAKHLQSKGMIVLTTHRPLTSVALTSHSVSITLS